MEKPDKIGIKFSPEFFADFFASKREIYCVDPIAAEYKLRNYGYDSILDEFFIIWETPGCPEVTAVEWITPTIFFREKQ